MYGKMKEQAPIHFHRLANIVAPRQLVSYSRLKAAKERDSRSFTAILAALSGKARRELPDTVDGREQLSCVTGTKQPSSAAAVRYPDTLEKRRECL